MAETIIQGLFSLLFIGSGLLHLANPEFFIPLMPARLPAHKTFIYLSGVVEIIVGLGLAIAPVRIYAVWGVILLLIGFAPLHVLDLRRESPAVGSKGMAAARLAMQFVMLAAAFYLL